MSQQTSRVLVLAIAVSAGAIGGYLFGFVAGHYATRTGEAAADLIIPMEDYRSKRLRRQAIREELTRLRNLQETIFSETGHYASVDELEVAPMFILRARVQPETITVREPRRRAEAWMATLSHDKSPVGETCAVVLGTDRWYAPGVPLKRAGSVRCSWDLATKLNRFW